MSDSSTASTAASSGTSTGGVSSTTTSTTSTSTMSTSGTTTGNTTGAESSSTGDPLGACGQEGFGEAEMYGRMYKQGQAQACENISRHLKVVGAEEGIVYGLPCSSNPKFGCSECEVGFEFGFEITTPVPEGEIAVGSCIYLALQDSLPLGDAEMCRYRQAALWSGDGAPTDFSPLAILGHNTLSVPDAVPAITAVDLQVSTLAVEDPCGCVEADDCCVEKTANYDLKFDAGNQLLLTNGGIGPFKYDSASFTVYNGGAYENGMCEESQRFDWWLLRD